jgi:excisionase family DNA binding protein
MKRSAIGMTVRQAAKYIGISTSTLRRWADEGYIECSRTPGNQRRFQQDELDRFIDLFEPKERTDATLRDGDNRASA